MSKVTLVGAGSVLWAPKILGDFYVSQARRVDEICLMDVNAAALEPIVALASRMEDRTGRGLSVTAETDLERAAAGADYVVVSIAVGGLEAMARDLEVPTRFGTYPTVGDTVGPSGLSRLLRNAPVFLDLAARIESAAPRAWLINLSNPLTPLTWLIGETTSLKTVGLCAGIVNHLWILKDLLEVAGPEEVDFSVAGIDHCSWFLELKARERDLYPRLRAMSVDELDAGASLGHSLDEWAGLDSLTAGFTLFEALGYLPAISDRHLGEFFPYFLSGDRELRRYNMKRTGISHRQRWGREARERLRAILSGEREPGLSKSRDIVVDVIEALDGAGAIRTTVNYRNAGQVGGLPDGAVVETAARVSTGRIEPEAVDGLPPQLLAVVEPHIHRQQLAVRAALEGSRELFTAALATDPTVYSLERVGELVNALIEANRDHLPRFREPGAARPG